MEDDFSCIVYEQGRLCTKYLDQLICQYRSSPNIVAVLTAVLNQLECSEEALARLCDCLDVDTATGDCLTFIGTLVGWPRTHCAAQCGSFLRTICDPDDADNTVLPLCEARLLCSANTNLSSGRTDYTFVDDDLYRRFIKAQIQANNSIGTASEVLSVARLLFDDDAVCLAGIENGVVRVFVPRLLTAVERSIIELIYRILPVAIGGEVQIFEAEGPPVWMYCSASNPPTCADAVTLCNSRFACSVELEC